MKRRHTHQCDVQNHREALTWEYKVLANNCQFNALGKKWHSKRQSLQHCCMSLQSSHLALIDTLMMAYTVEMVSVERVMSCINRYSSAEPSHSDRHIQELPYDTEDAIITWINKVHTGALLCAHKATRICALKGQRLYTSQSFLQWKTHSSLFYFGYRRHERCWKGCQSSILPLLDQSLYVYKKTRWH